MWGCGTRVLLSNHPVGVDWVGLLLLWLFFALFEVVPLCIIAFAEPLVDEWKEGSLSSLQRDVDWTEPGPVVRFNLKCACGWGRTEVSGVSRKGDLPATICRDWDCCGCCGCFNFFFFFARRARGMLGKDSCQPYEEVGDAAAASRSGVELGNCLMARFGSTDRQSVSGRSLARSRRHMTAGLALPTTQNSLTLGFLFPDFTDSLIFRHWDSLSTNK